MTTAEQFANIGAAALEVSKQYDQLNETLRQFNEWVSRGSVRSKLLRMHKRPRPRSGYVPSPGGMQRWRHRQLRDRRYAQGAGEVAP